MQLGVRSEELKIKSSTLGRFALQRIKILLLLLLLFVLLFLLSNGRGFQAIPDWLGFIEEAR